MSPTPLALAAAGLALLAAVVVGTLAHELSHALALAAAGVPATVALLPDRDRASDRDRTGPLRAGLAGRWATVTPDCPPEELDPGALRASALMPLALAAPFVLVPLGVLPDPVATGDPALTTAALGWLACALPSPRDFSLAWYPGRAIAEESR